MFQIERPFSNIASYAFEHSEETSYWTIPVLYCLGNINEL